MTIEAVRAQLHEYIEHAEKSKVMAIYTLVQQEVVTDDVVYDEETLNMLETRFDDMVSGKDKTVTLEQTIDNLRQYRKQYGL
jgi:hypothetical protein